MIGNLEIQKHFFRPICNEREIERIFNVKDAKDFLLKLRAETIVDHMRLFRVFRNKALMQEGKWSLEDSFEHFHYDAFVQLLPLEYQNMCRVITYGNIFSNDPNGSIFATEHGPIITICDSLRFFLKFMHLALLEFADHVPPHVRMNALRIAIRVMLGSEALDFLMDPRGMVPKSIADAMHAPIQFQLQFIAGHEFAHHILGHLSESNVKSKPIYFAISTKDEDYKPMQVYNRSQKEELDADAQSILLPKHKTVEGKQLFEATLLWFGCLELYEAASAAICPSIPWDYETHPSATQRFDALLMIAPRSFKIRTKHWREFLARIDYVKKILLEDISRDVEAYETYGSAYLDAPNTEWRGPELIDRVDYY